MADTLFLGIVSDRSTCKARLCNDAGDILAETDTDTAATLQGHEKAMAEINLVATKALALAGLAADRVIELHVGAGLAGLSLAREQKRLPQIPHRFAGFSAHAHTYVACLGAHDGEDGGIVVTDTDSCAALIDKGEYLSFGGWGFLLSDQGSGAALGRAGLRRALLGHDQVLPQSPMGSWIMAQFGQSPETMAIWAEKASASDYASFAARIYDFAREDDPVAVEISRQIANDLAVFARALRERSKGPVCLAGEFAEPARPWMPADIRDVISAPRGDSLDGALIMARRTHKKRQAGAA